ncbi:hypothetical protein Bpfe_028599 [Biomphalaria pfeifferi]|uniref:Uncharacterized protein n=1 Tax=Biomphalaria pfeifferi TaxID=112525 RepID=A0AAD8AT34_BIOPF|nr:hypothetical protein Bpfe_028599 [Biomphalaria pfeifferi]
MTPKGVQTFPSLRSTARERKWFQRPQHAECTPRWLECTRIASTIHLHGCVVFTGRPPAERRWEGVKPNDAEERDERTRVEKRICRMCKGGYSSFALGVR